jgi:predicted RNA-binding protein
MDRRLFAPGLTRFTVRAIRCGDVVITRSGTWRGCLYAEMSEYVTISMKAAFKLDAMAGIKRKH